MFDDLNNDYELLDKVGEGGLCVIWKVRSRKSNQPYAFKQIKFRDDANFQALKSEYRFLKFHRHPGIIKAWEFYVLNSLPGFVMDYLPGHTLAIDCGKLNKRDLLNKIASILETANFVYHCGYIYNDYKPQNFVYDADGNLILIDFNLIGPRGEVNGKKSGTLGYLAPELITGQPASPASDIYSLGATFYELATGRMPFSAPNEGALIKLVTESIPDNPGTQNEFLNQTIMKMLALSPSDRPACPYEICKLLGLEDNLAKELKANITNYLFAGYRPYTREFVELILDDKSIKRPTVVVSGGKHEHQHFIDQVTDMLKLEHDTVMVYADPETSEINTADKPLKSVRIIDCQNILNDDIVNSAGSVSGKGICETAVILFAHSVDYRQYADRVGIFSLPDKADYILKNLTYCLKNYQVSNDFIEAMNTLAEGDSEVAITYIEYLLAAGYFEFGPGGWLESREFEESSVPPVLMEACRDALAQMTPKSAVILQWLAVLAYPVETSMLATLTEIGLAKLNPELKKLEIERWSKEQEGRYRIMGLAKQRAIYENIPPDIRQALHRQAAAWFIKNKPADIENLARHCFAAEDYFEALRYNYLAALKRHNDFDFKRAKEFIDIAEKVILSLGSDKRPVQLYLNIFILAGDIAKALADNSRAEDKYLAAVALAGEIDAKEPLATAYKNLGDLYRLQQKSSKSIKFSTTALKLYDIAHDLPHRAACLNNIGLAYWTSGKYEQALKYFEEALKANEELGNLAEQAKIYNNIGIIYDITGRANEVLDQFNLALDCAVKVKNLDLEAKFLGNIGFFFLNSGKPHKSLGYLKKGYEIAARTGNNHEQLNIMSNIALAYHKMGNFIKSAEANQQALEIAASLNHEMFQAQSSLLLVRDCLAMGNYKLAAEMLTRAKNICSSLSNPELLVEILHTNIELELKLGDFIIAGKLIDQLRDQPGMTHQQKLKTEFLQVKLAFCQNEVDAPGMAEDLLNKCENTDSIEITGLAILELSRFLLKLDKQDEVFLLLKKFQKLDINNTVINLECDLIKAELFLKRKEYNEALELISQIQQKANNSGCLPTLFECAVLRAMVFSDCRKESLMVKAVAQAQTILNSIENAYPENIDMKLITELPMIKMYNELADRTKAIALNSNRIAP